MKVDDKSRTFTSHTVIVRRKAREIFLFKMEDYFMDSDLVKFLIPFLFSISAVIIPLIFNFIIEQKKISLEILKLNSSVINDRNILIRKYLSIFSYIISGEYKNKVFVDVDIDTVTLQEKEVVQDEKKSYYNTLSKIFELLTSNVHLLTKKSIKLFIKLSRMYNDSNLNSYHFFKDYVGESEKANEYLSKSINFIYNNKGKMNNLLNKIQLDLMELLVKLK